MNKLMITYCCMVAVGCLWAKPELAVTVEVASFGENTKKMTMIGTMINNPIVPTLAIGAGQQQLAQTFGRFRSDAPMFVQVYVDNEVGNDADDNFAEKMDAALIYPSAMGAATMLLNHPGSTKSDDGVIHLLAGTANPKDRWVKFDEDGKYCAIASSAGSAKRAIADWSAGKPIRAARAGKSRPFARIDMLEPMIEFVCDLQTKRNAKNAAKIADSDIQSAFINRLVNLRAFNNDCVAFKKFNHLCLTIDIDETGLVFGGHATLKNGVKAPEISGMSLPPEALNALPGGASLFAAMLANYNTAYKYDGDADYKKDVDELADLIRNELVADVKGCKKMQKYSTFIEECANALADAIRGADKLPAKSDWLNALIAFNGDMHPYIVLAGKDSNYKKSKDVESKFMTRIMAALDKQWPGKNIIVKTPKSYIIDWAAAIDTGVAETCPSNKCDEIVRATNNAKKTIRNILGDTKTESTLKTDGANSVACIAAPGFKMPVIDEKKSVGRLMKVLPEIKAEQPVFVAFIPLYGISRDVVLPLVAKQCSPKEAQEWTAIINAQPKAEEDSAIASAAWIGKNGSLRFLMRITANELKNYGAAFNAFTAASMKQSLNVGEDEESAEEE